ncbi:MAG: hypothetical protein R3E87_26815 [Burkholderiaceae bacterium]
MNAKHNVQDTNSLHGATDGASATVDRRRLFIALASVAVCWPMTVRAQSPNPATQARSTSADVERSAALDRLFEALAAAPDEDAARRIENDIWMRWTSHADPRVDALMRSVLADRRVAAYERALSNIEKILAIDPDYAEAYNQRATIEFHRGNDFESLQAIAEALEREPRHFGSLAGRAIIRLRQGKPALAIQSLLGATAVHPFLRERHLLTQLGYQPPANASERRAPSKP